MSNLEAAIKALLLSVLFFIPLTYCTVSYVQETAAVELTREAERQLVTGDFRKALDTAERLIALKQNAGYVLYLEVCFRSGDLARAKKALAEIEEKKVDLGDSRGRIEEIRSMVSLKDGEIEKALSAATYAMSHKSPDSDQSLARVTRSLAYSKKHDYTNAIRDIDVVINKSSCSPEYFYLRGTYYEGLGNLKRAMQDYSAALCWEPKLPSVYQRRAAILHRTGEHLKAAAELEKAREIQEDSKNSCASFSSSLRWIPYDLSNGSASSTGEAQSHMPTRSK